MDLTYTVALWFVELSGDDNEEDEDDGFEGTPRPMLPYSSMYIFGPTNP